MIDAIFSASIYYFSSSQKRFIILFSNKRCPYYVIHHFYQYQHQIYIYIYYSSCSSIGHYNFIILLSIGKYLYRFSHDIHQFYRSQYQTCIRHERSYHGQIFFYQLFNFRCKRPFGAINPVGRPWMHSAMQLQVECPA